MHVAERKFASTQPPLDQVAGVRMDDSRGARRAQPPRSLPRAFIALSRADAAAALAVATLAGATLGWWETGRANPLALIVIVLGAWTTTLALNLLSEYYDYRESIAAGVGGGYEGLFTGYDFMLHNVISATTVRNLGFIFAAIGGLTILVLTWAVGWPMLILSGSSLALAFAHTVPPIRYSRVGWGLGELGILLSYGILQVTAGYYAQTQTVSWLPVCLGIAFGLFAVSIFVGHSFVYYRRDWITRKHTLVVDLGVARSLDVSTVLVVLSYVAILASVSLTAMPLLMLLALATLPIALNMFGRMERHYVRPDQAVHLYGSTVNAALVTGLLLCLALWIDRF